MLLFSSTKVITMAILTFFTSLLLIFSGLLFSIQIKFSHLSFTKLLKEQKNCSKSAFSSFCLSLGGIMGAGNIAGVAIAIKFGGAGSVLWMLVSALICMPIKYFEIYFGIKQKSQKYPVGYINKKALSFVFCVLCILSSFTTGGMIQANAVSQGTNYALKTKFALAFLFCIFFCIFAFVIKKGAQRFCLAAVPLMTGLYFIMCTCILFINIRALPEVFVRIVNEAFNLKSGLYGGIAGIVTAARYGFSIGLLSHEAGLGTAPLAHTQEQNKNPHLSGSLGILEVYADTFLGALFSALCILVTNSDTVHGAFESVFSDFGNIFVNTSLLLFAFSSCITWNYYGQICTKKSLGNNCIPVYNIIYIILLFVSFFLSADKAYGFGEITNALMALVNTISLLMCLRHFFNSNK